MPISAGISATISTRPRSRYLMEHEWAMTSDDVLWRRTKRGLHAATRSMSPRSTISCRAARAARSGG